MYLFPKMKGCEKYLLNIMYSRIKRINRYTLCYIKLLSLRSPFQDGSRSYNPDYPVPGLNWA